MESGALSLLRLLSLQVFPLWVEEVETLLYNLRNEKYLSSNFQSSKLKTWLRAFCESGFIITVRLNKHDTPRYAIAEDRRMSVLSDCMASDPALIGSLSAAMRGRQHNHRYSYDFDEDAYRRQLLSSIGFAAFERNAAALEETWEQAAFSPESLADPHALADWLKLGKIILTFLQTSGKQGILPKALSGAILRAFETQGLMTGQGDDSFLGLFASAGLAIESPGSISLLIQGRIRDIIDQASKAREPAARNEPTVQLAHSLALLLSGDEEAALAKLDDLYENHKDPASAGQVNYIDSALFPFHALWFLTRGRLPLARIKAWTKAHRAEYEQSAGILWALARNLGKADARADFQFDMGKRVRGIQTLLDVFFYGIAGSWLSGITTEERKALLYYADAMRERGALWYELELRLLAGHGAKPAAKDQRITELRKITGIKLCLSELFTPQEEWSRKLELLRALADSPADAGPGSDERFIWCLDPERLFVTAALQRRLKNGAWSVPKTIALSRLKARDLPGLEPVDMAVLSAYVKHEGYRDTYLDPLAALPLLAGHPRVFLAGNPEIKIDLSHADIELKVEEGDGDCVFSFSSDPSSREPSMEKIGPATYMLHFPSEGIRRVAKIIGKELTVPSSAKKDVLDVLKGISGFVRVSSPLLAEHREARRVNTDPRILLHLLPLRDGLRLSVHVRPLGDIGPCLRPATGSATLSANHEGVLYATLRDLATESNNLEGLLELCPVLEDRLDNEGCAELLDPLDCLEFLSSIRDAGERLRVEWPKGGKIKLGGRLSSANAKFSIKKSKEWFAAGGNLVMDDGTLLGLEVLLPLLSRARGRFLPLSEGEYIELEARFMQQLRLISSLGTLENGLLRISSPALAASDILLDPESTEALDSGAREFRERVKRAFSSEPALPENMSAELRPYQVDGFRWLKRLSDIGAGACLADDMGLGKTIQCIALICDQAAQGPSLVIAPTSVCANWMAEFARFAPRLDVRLLGGNDRGGLLAGMGAGTVLVTSYGLAVNEIDLLSQSRWQVLVLDEAQAIKNRNTKRFKAILELQACAKVAATGTPLQNHLGELWTLFHFLNPGYLGSQGAFIQRFVIPIQESGDDAARRALKDMLRPFMLRRTKTQVLSELPSKTEISLYVELGSKERAVYELLRRKALEEMTAIRDENEGKKRIIALVHLTRLRRACCHPSLVSDLEGGEAVLAKDELSAKLEALEGLVEELRENGHRALIFSQFVDHLSLIRGLLDRKGLAYEYLDGSTPAAHRSAAVARFQAGGPDLFLISLKAGGLGLNLTAADYVIHMDPWWNPAIEDQASDRAYRIGQSRPVTIYRLVAKDSIEESIVELHSHKRELSDALLEGAEAAAGLNADDLLALVAGESHQARG